jgi:hypothetical protein
MLGFKSFYNARRVLIGIELMQKIVKAASPFAPDERLGGSDEHNAYHDDVNAGLEGLWPIRADVSGADGNSLYRRHRCFRRSSDACPQNVRAIGVTIRWHDGLRNCLGKGILMSLTRRTSTTSRPGALAYALPYESTHIEVFYDRISRYGSPTMVSIVVPHVVVHEITHILEGIVRHSGDGIMKANWGEQDFFYMRQNPLMSA